MSKSQIVVPATVNSPDYHKQVELLRAAADTGFHFDHFPRVETWRASKALVDAGLLDCWESGSDEAQYTAMNFRITDLGREALRSVSTNG